MRYMQADDFYENSADMSPGGFHFGSGSRKAIAGGVVKFLEGLLEGRILMQKINLQNDINMDDYNFNTITFVYAETTDPMPPEENLVNIARVLNEWRMKVKRGDSPVTFKELAVILKRYTDENGKVVF